MSDRWPCAAETLLIFLTCLIPVAFEIAAPEHTFLACRKFLLSSDLMSMIICVLHHLFGAFCFSKKFQTHELLAAALWEGQSNSPAFVSQMEKLGFLDSTQRHPYSRLPNARRLEGQVRDVGVLVD